MSAMRDKDQADWDLERCFEMFDQALISKDERVVNALRNLLMIVTLTAPETELSGIESRKGPLRRIMDDINGLTRHINIMDDELRELRKLSTQYSNIKETDHWRMRGRDWNMDTTGGMGGGSDRNGGGMGGGPGVAAIGHFATDQEVHVQNKIRGLRDNEC
jgi:hypothetical protein